MTVMVNDLVWLSTKLFLFLNFLFLSFILYEFVECQLCSFLCRIQKYKICSLLRNFGLQVTEGPITGLSSKHLHYLAEQRFWRYTGPGLATSAVPGCRTLRQSYWNFVGSPSLEENNMFTTEPKVTSSNSPTQSKNMRGRLFLMAMGGKCSKGISRFPLCLLDSSYDPSLFSSQAKRKCLL